MDKTIEISDDIVRAAQDATGVVDEREAIEKAVKAYIASKGANPPLQGMLDLVGQVKLRDDYDHKAARQDRHDPD